MATEYDLKLVVDADTSAAERKLDAIGGGQGGNRPSSVPGSPPPSSPLPAGPSPAAQEAANRVRDEIDRVTGGAGAGAAAGRGRGGGGKAGGGAGSGKAAGAAAGEFGRSAGDVAGRMIGKAVAGFVAHQLAGLVFSSIKTTGGDNRAVNKAEAGVGGALQWGTVGMMLGGPWGAAIGAAAGALSGLAQEAVRQKKAREARDLEIDNANYARARDTPIRASDRAFDQALGMSGGWRQRVEMLRARRDEIANGEGQWSVKNLKAAVDKSDPESAVGQRLAASLEVQKNRLAAIDERLVQEGLPWQPGRLEAGSVTDSWAKKGIGVGATVDVSQVNDRIMSEVQDCRRLLERIADMGTDRLHTIGAMQRTVFE